MYITYVHFTLNCFSLRIDLVVVKMCNIFKNNRMKAKQLKTIFFLNINKI